MALPKIDQPIYTVDLISQKKPVSFRPFLVKEHKLLMMAVESGKMKDILSAIKQILRNCALGNIDVDSLPIVDLELFFTNIRARSVGEIIEQKYKCTNIVEGVEGECGQPFSMKIDLLNDIQIINHNTKNKIELSPTIGLIMKLPTTETMEEFVLEDSDDIEQDPEKVVNEDIQMAVNCIESIYDAEGVYSAKDSTKEELVEFVNMLNDKQYSQLEEFFKNIPSLYVEKSHICSKCGFEHKVRLEGIADFFM